MSKVVVLTFETEDDYRKARDINLEILEREGWKPSPDFVMWIPEGPRLVELTERVASAGVKFQVSSPQ